MTRDSGPRDRQKMKITPVAQRSSKHAGSRVQYIKWLGYSDSRVESGSDTLTGETGQEIMQSTR